MPDKPCILCGKEVHAFMGSKTVFIPAPGTPRVLGYGDSYAYCGCGGSSSAVEQRIRFMSEEQKSRSLVERRLPK